MEKNPQHLDLLKRPVPLSHYCIRSARPPAVQHHQSNFLFTLSAVCYAVEAAALFRDSHGRCFCVCMCASVRGVRVVIGTQDDQEERYFYILKQPLSFAATKQCTAVAIQQQRYNGSRDPSSRLCACSHGVCVCGWGTAAGDRTTTALHGTMIKTLTRTTQE